LQRPANSPRSVGRDVYITPKLADVSCFFGVMAHCARHMHPTKTGLTFGACGGIIKIGNERAKYGEYLLTNLSRHLTDALGKGFSYANLRNFRQFYLVFPTKEFCYTLCSELSWSHLRLIMRLDSEEERNYYLGETGFYRESSTS